MNSKWFWFVLSTVSCILLVVYGIRIVAWGNADVPLFTQFLKLYNNTDFGGSFIDIYNDFYNFLQDYIYLENVTMPDLLPFNDISAWYDIFSVIYNIGILIVNIFITLFNLVYSFVVFIISASLNIFNVLYELIRIWLVFLQFTLGLVP